MIKMQRKPKPSFMINFACFAPHPPLLLPDIGSSGDREKVKKTIELLAIDGASILSCKAAILMATIEASGGNIPEAIALFRNAIESLNIFEPTEELARAHNNLGEIYKDTEDYASATEQYEKCVDISEQINNSRGYLYGLSNMAECYAFMDQVIEAKDTLKRVEDLLAETQEKYVMAHVPYIRGLILYSEKNYIGACKEFEIAIERLEIVGSLPYDTGIFWYRYGLAFKASEEKEMAWAAFEKAKKNFTKINAKLYLKKLLTHI